MDSAVTLAEAAAAGFAPYALTFDYGQRHAHELAAARRVAAALGAADHRVVRIDLAARREVATFFRAHPIASGERALRQTLERFDWYRGFRRRAVRELTTWLSG